MVYQQCCVRLGAEAKLVLVGDLYLHFLDNIALFLPFRFLAFLRFPFIHASNEAHN